MACVIAAAGAAVGEPADGAFVGATPASIVPVQTALLGQQATLPAWSRAQTAFLPQQTLAPMFEQDVAHLSERRKRLRLKERPSIGLIKGEYLAASIVGGRRAKHARDVARYIMYTERSELACAPSAGA